jgi:hypothetical protein
LREDIGKQNPLSKLGYLFSLFRQFDSLSTAGNNVFTDLKLSTWVVLQLYSKQHACPRANMRRRYSILFSQSGLASAWLSCMSMLVLWFFCKIIFCTYIQFIYHTSLYLGYVVHMYRLGCTYKPMYIYCTKMVSEINFQRKFDLTQWLPHMLPSETDPV